MSQFLTERILTLSPYSVGPGANHPNCLRLHDKYYDTFRERIEPGILAAAAVDFDAICSHRTSGLQSTTRKLESTIITTAEG